MTAGGHAGHPIALADGEALFQQQALRKPATQVDSKVVGPSLKEVARQGMDGEEGRCRDSCRPFKNVVIPVCGVQFPLPG